MNDRNNMREKFWDLAGTKMGNLLKIKKSQETIDKEKLDKAEISKDDEVDYRADNQFAQTLNKQQNNAVTEFSQ